MEPDIAWQAAEQRDSLPDQDGDASEDQAPDQAGGKEFLNGDAAVDVEMMKAASGKLHHDLAGISGHLFDDACADGGEVEGATAQDHDCFVAVGPFGKGQDRFKGLASDDERVDGGEKLRVAMRLTAAGREEIEIAVWARDESVDADADEDRSRNRMGSHGCHRRTQRRCEDGDILAWKASEVCDSISDRERGATITRRSGADG